MKTLCLAIISAAICTLAHAQIVSTNINYSTGGTNVPGYTGFFNTADGWTSSGNPLWEGQDGWTGSGSGADSVSDVTGTTPTSPAGNGSGTLGVFLPALPLNTTNIYLSRAFTPGGGPYALVDTTVSFIAEFSLLSFGPSQDDTFTIDLRNASDTVSLLSFRINNQGVTDPLSYNFLLSSIGASTSAQFEGAYGGLYRMQVDVLGSAFSGSYSLIDPVTRTNLASFSFNPGALAGGYTSADIGALRLSWALDSGDPNAPGDVGFVANEFTVATSGTAVPEPGTWGTALLLLAGAAYVVRRRKAAHAVLEQGALGEGDGDGRSRRDHGAMPQSGL